MMKRLFVAMLAMCVICSGCGKKMSEKLAEKIIEKGMEKDGVKANVNLSEGKMTVQTKDGNMTIAGGGSAKIPENFPKDVFVYDGATVMAVVTVPEGCNVSLQTKDSSEKVTSAYKSKMNSNGWKEEAAYTTDQQTMVSYKKENRTANVIIVSADGNTQINLTVVEEKSSKSE